LPWSVTRLGGAADAATVRCSVTADSPDLLRQFPFPFRLSLTFALRDATLRIGVTAENLGAVPMPCGFGWHPYFRLPLVPGGSRAAELIEVPARRQWVLDAAWLPTGETIPVPADRDFLTPRPLGDRYLDDVYTDVVRTDGASACTMQDPGSGVTVRLAAGPSFREWVVYAPPTRPTIAFEPYTCPTDAFNLAWRGIDAGVIVLPPGGRWEDWLELSVAA
jgi:aldose 1-epimerase